jgi:hypothetical protein
MKSGWLAIKERFVSFCRKRKITKQKIANGVELEQNIINECFNLKSNVMPDLNVVYWLIKEHKLDIEWLMSGNKTHKNSEINKTMSGSLNEQTIIQKCYFHGNQYISQFYGCENCVLKTAF